MAIRSVQPRSPEVAAGERRPDAEGIPPNVAILLRKVVGVAVRDRPIDVLLDGAFIEQSRTGSGQYTAALWRELAAVGDLRVALAVPDDVAAPSPPPVYVYHPPRLAVHPKLRKLWWEQWGLPGLAARLRPGLLHIPYFAAPWWAPCPMIVTVHDVIPLVLPEYGESLAMRCYLALVRRTVRRARLVLTDSEWSRRDIERVLGLPADRIRVIPLGVDDRFRPADDPRRFSNWLQRWGIAGPVILNVGGFDVRKNLPLLVRAFAQALPALPPGTTLVIPGRAHSGNARLYPPLEPLIQQLGLTSHVLLPGPVSDEEKIVWYQAATIYAYPSLYEGFGLSPLEAMACGVPVVAANRTSIPEVVGDAGLLVDPTEEAFASALVRLLADPELYRTLRARGLARARQFTWQRTARETAAVYREMLKLVRRASAMVGS